MAGAGADVIVESQVMLLGVWAGLGWAGLGVSCVESYLHVPAFTIRKLNLFIVPTSCCRALTSDILLSSDWPRAGHVTTILPSDWWRRSLQRFISVLSNFR